MNTTHAFTRIWRNSFFRQAPYIILGICCAFWATLPLRMYSDATEQEKILSELKKGQALQEELIANDTKTFEQYELLLQDYGDFIGAMRKGDIAAQDKAGSIMGADRAEVLRQKAYRDGIMKNLPTSKVETTVD